MATLKDILWVADKVPSDSPEVCVGQAISLTLGEHMRLRLSPGFTPSSTLGYFMKFIQNDTPGLVQENIISVMANNMYGHATRLFIFKNTSRTYIWYYNPWGYSADVTQTVHQSLSFDERFKDEQWWKDIKEIQIDELNKVHHAWPGVSRNEEDREIDFSQQITPEDRLLYSTKRFLSYVKKYATHIHSSLDQWVEQGTDMDDDTNQVCERIPHEHILSILVLLKTFFGKDHITIINPCNSMPSIGPQELYNDGCTNELTNFAREMNVLGSCVVWEEIYALHVHFLLNIALHKKVNHETILYTINNTLRYNDLLGEKHARNVIGKVVYSTTPHKKMAEILLQIFNIIPGKKDMDDHGHYYDNVKKMFAWALEKMENSKNRDEFQNITKIFLEEVTRARTQKNTIKQISDLIDAYSKDKKTEPLHQIDKFLNMVNYIMIMTACKHDVNHKKINKKRKR